MNSQSMPSITDAFKMKIYIETSVINFYFADDAPEKRDITRNFFNEIKKGGFSAWISDLVLDEISRAEEQKRTRLIELIMEHDLSELKMVKETRTLAEKYCEHGIIPKRFLADALHIAIATIYQMDVIVSWNMKHIVKLKTRRGVNAINKLEGYKEIEIVTPEEVL